MLPPGPNAGSGYSGLVTDGVPARSTSGAMPRPLLKPPYCSNRTCASNSSSAGSITAAYGRRPSLVREALFEPAYPVGSATSSSSSRRPAQCGPLPAPDSGHATILAAARRGTPSPGWRVRPRPSAVSGELEPLSTTSTRKPESVWRRRLRLRAALPAGPGCRSPRSCPGWSSPGRRSEDYAIVPGPRELVAQAGDGHGLFTGDVPERDLLGDAADPDRHQMVLYCSTTASSSSTGSSAVSSRSSTRAGARRSFRSMRSIRIFSLSGQPRSETPPPRQPTGRLTPDDASAANEIEL